MRKLPGHTLAPVRSFKPLDPEYNPWWWHPGRIGAKHAPKAFMDKLREVDPDGKIGITWNPLKERWAVFVRDEKFRHPICSGWKLLFLVEYQGAYVPLDERVLAVLYERSGRKWGNLWEYWLRVEQEIERDQARKERQTASERDAAVGEYYDYMQIKNIGTGSKFAKHHQ